MPNAGQLRMAAYHVMREFGLVRTTIKRVAAQMKAYGAQPGSDRDSSKMVRAFKEEQKAIGKLPPAVAKMSEIFATEIWQLALATYAQMELQRGGTDPEPPEVRPEARPLPRGPARITALQKAVEYILRPDAKQNLVRAPIAGEQIFRLLTDRQSRLTDEKHINRDLRRVEQQCKSVYRLPAKTGTRGGKWWLRGRPLPPGYGEDGKVVRKWVPRGTPLSRARTANRPVMEDAIAELITAKRPMSVAEIIHNLGVPAERQDAFRLMMRNHLRGKNPRFLRGAGGQYYVEQAGRKTNGG